MNEQHTLKEWLESKKAEYSDALRRPALIVPAKSLAARGYYKTGRQELATFYSPWGGKYSAFDSLTEREFVEIYGG